MCRDIALSTIAKSCVRNTCFMWHHCSLSRWRLQDRGTKCHMKSRSPKLPTNCGSKRKWCKTKDSNSVGLPMYSRDIETGREVRMARNLNPMSTTSAWQPKVTVREKRTDGIAVIALRVVLVNISGVEGDYKDDKCQPTPIYPSNLPSPPSYCGVVREISQSKVICH